MMVDHVRNADFKKGKYDWPQQFIKKHRLIKNEVNKTFQAIKHILNIALHLITTVHFMKPRAEEQKWHIHIFVGYKLQIVFALLPWQSFSDNFLDHFSSLLIILISLVIVVVVAHGKRNKNNNCHFSTTSSLCKQTNIKNPTRLHFRASVIRVHQRSSLQSLHWRKMTQSVPA